MKKIVIYSSKTNNTEKIAKKLASFDEDIELKKTTEIDEIDSDILFIGGWIDKGVYNSELQSFIENVKNKTISFFFTLGAYPNSMHAYSCIENIKSILEKNGNKVISHFHCQGSIDPKLISWMKTLDSEHAHYPDEARQKRWSDAEKHPNEEDYNSLFSYYQYTIKKVQEGK